MATKPSQSDDLRATELDWIAENRAYLWANYAGMWIAVQGSELVAAGPDLDAVLEEASAKGFPDPLVTTVRGRGSQSLRIVR